MSASALSAVKTHSLRRGDARVLLETLADGAHTDGTAHCPDFETLERWTHIPISEVAVIITRLVESGELHWPFEFIQDEPCYKVESPGIPVRQPRTPPKPPRTPPRSAPGFVYLFSGGAFYKIGQARDVGLRLKDWQGLPFRVYETHRIAVSNMTWAERLLQRRFAGHRVNGEWFLLPPEEVAWICSLTTLEPE